MLSVLLPNLLILSAIILFLYYLIVLVKENKINRKQNEETQQLLREILKEVKSNNLEQK
ncbi:hypothetical protein N399_11095 [Bacillus licheniformis CG-B52]|jgi:Na+-translocating ferredoxin:NAD+ oxidoreductase RnfG subunit|nr:hypothetical protein B34_00326 [Bacillus licheniformis]EQM28350.1 hypothetical protein N399_11095 [Bacillus licheniformis CG-B52]MBJ7886647.1 hypothetical protein [Bacillaceae bacterium HSR45]ARC73557.1 hypothetical protein B37_01505 [Bacillus licheniformis]ARW42694.1 hypothetical protein S100141_01372 [Bacillus licheniformis]